jgi:hypothetical protein
LPNNNSLFSSRFAGLLARFGKIAFPSLADSGIRVTLLFLKLTAVVFAPDSLLIPCNKQEGTKRRKGKKNDCVFRLHQTREEKIIKKHLTNHF